MKTGLFFGTFNPIHVGHLIIANYMATHTDLKEVWLVVTPQNPLKNKETLLKDNHRLALVKIAIEDNPALRASNIEFKLPKPSYTIHTLLHLQEKYPKREFVLIMGEDNLQTLHKWKNYEQILKNYQLYVYPRVSAEKTSLNLLNHPQVKLFKDIPLMLISATYIRHAIKTNKNVRYLLTPNVLKYIEEMNFYK